MRVTHIITRLVVGGAQENTVATVFGLRNRSADGSSASSNRIEVNLLSGPTTGPEGSLESEVKKVPGLLTTIPELVRPVHPLKDFLALRRLTVILRQTRPDIVHTHSGKAGILGRLAAKRADVPLVIHTITARRLEIFRTPPPTSFSAPLKGLPPVPRRISSLLLTR